MAHASKEEAKRDPTSRVSLLLDSTGRSGLYPSPADRKPSGATMNAVTWERALQEELRNIRRTTLPNGLTIVSERMDHLRSVCVGIWVRTGSRDEASEINGISHFLEHMVFKGTKTRSAEDIARQMDSIGGNLDAFTAKECVCFNIKVLDEHLAPAMDILCDLVLAPIFNEEDIAKERGVIVEEIKMDE